MRSFGYAADVTATSGSPRERPLQSLLVEQHLVEQQVDLRTLPHTTPYVPATEAGSYIPIYRWRQMRHGQFWGNHTESIKSLILSFNIQKCEFCAQI